jgi:hypothetical protein
MSLSHSQKKENARSILIGLTGMRPSLHHDYSSSFLRKRTSKNVPVLPEMLKETG